VRENPHERDPIERVEEDATRRSQKYVARQDCHLKRGSDFRKRKKRHQKNLYQRKVERKKDKFLKQRGKSWNNKTPKLKPDKTLETAKQLGGPFLKQGGRGRKNEKKNGREEVRKSPEEIANPSSN